MEEEQIQYDNCFFCESVVEEHLLTRDIRWKGKLVIIENVPTGICSRCGEKFLRPEVAKTIDAALESAKRPTRVLQVPVYQYQMM